MCGHDGGGGGDGFQDGAILKYKVCIGQFIKMGGGALLDNVLENGAFV